MIRMKKYIYLIILISTLCTSCAQRKAETQALTDMYNAHVVLFQGRAYAENWYRYEDMSMQDSLQAMPLPEIKENSVREWMNTYVQETERLLGEQPDSAAIFQSIDVYNVFSEQLRTHYLMDEQAEADWEKRYQTEKEKWGINTLLTLYEETPDKGIQEIEKRIEAATDFGEKSLLACAYARFLYWEDPERFQIVIPILDELMTSHTYTIYLPEVWRIWRCAVQYQYGQSKDSEIPNNLYNAKRQECLTTLLEHILAYPEDCIAVNLFKYIAFLPDVFREGTYPYGNQIALEMYDMGFY